MIVKHTGQQEASITLRMFQAAFVFRFFNGIAAVTGASRFGGTDDQIFCLLRTLCTSGSSSEAQLPESGAWKNSFVGGQSPGWAAAPPKGV